PQSATLHLAHELCIGDVPLPAREGSTLEYELREGVGLGPHSQQLRSILEPGPIYFRARRATRPEQVHNCVVPIDHQRRYGETDRLGSLQINDHLQLRREPTGHFCRHPRVFLGGATPYPRTYVATKLPITAASSRLITKVRPQKSSCWRLTRSVPRTKLVSSSLKCSSRLFSIACRPQSIVNLAAQVSLPRTRYNASGSRTGSRSRPTKRWEQVALLVRNDATLARGAGGGARGGGPDTLRGDSVRGVKPGRASHRESQRVSLAWPTTGDDGSGAGGRNAGARRSADDGSDARH